MTGATPEAIEAVLTEKHVVFSFQFVAVQQRCLVDRRSLGFDGSVLSCCEHIFFNVAMNNIWSHRSGGNSNSTPVQIVKITNSFVNQKNHLTLTIMISSEISIETAS
jgi:hypothetical protein